jgi:hypothetical protein
MEKFLTRFSKKLSQIWDGDIEIFSVFQNELDDILKDPVEDFWRCLA